MSDIALGPSRTRLKKDRLRSPCGSGLARSGEPDVFLIAKGHADRIEKWGSGVASPGLCFPSLSPSGRGYRERGKRGRARLLPSRRSRS